MRARAVAARRRAADRCGARGLVAVVVSGRDHRAAGRCAERVLPRVVAADDAARHHLRRRVPEAVLQGGAERRAAVRAPQHDVARVPHGLFRAECTGLPAGLGDRRRRRVADGHLGLPQPEDPLRRLQLPRLDASRALRARGGVHAHVRRDRLVRLPIVRPPSSRSPVACAASPSCCSPRRSRSSRRSSLSTRGSRALTRRRRRTCRR